MPHDRRTRSTSSRTSFELLPVFQATSTDTVGTGSQSSGRNVTPGGNNPLIESGGNGQPEPLLHELQMTEHVVGSRDGMHAGLRASR